MLLRERLGVLLAGLPPPEADALARALPRVAATLSENHHHADRRTRLNLRRTHTGRDHDEP